jgi:hypothetical protein
MDALFRFKEWVVDGSVLHFKAHRKRFLFLLAVVVLPWLLLASTCWEAAAAPANNSGTFWLGPGQGTDIMLPKHTSMRPLSPQAETIGTVTGYVVRVAYIVPTNRTAQLNAVSDLRNVVTQHQKWYREQMDRNGFGPKSFTCETEADGITPRVYVVNVTNTDANLRIDLWNNTINAASAAGVPVWTPKQVWWLISEAHVEMSDGSITGGTSLGASFGSGDDPGVAVVGGDFLARYNPAYFTNDNGYNGTIIPEIGPYPLVQSVSFPWFEGSTFSSISSSVVGAGIHEISHGFGLPHDFRNDANFNGNLMGNGLRGFHGALYPALYPSDYTRCAYGAALALNVSRYFNPSATYTDNTPPTVNINTSGTNTPVNGSVLINFSASDASGLAAAWLLLDGNMVGEMPLSGTSVNRTFMDAWYTPGQTNNYTVSVFDLQGNRQDANTAIVPTTGHNQAPQPYLQFSPTTAIIGSNTVLDALSSVDPDGSTSTLRVEWDLNGDGIFDTSPSFNLTLTNKFLTSGTGLIRARLTDPSGAQTVSTPLGIRIVPSPTFQILRRGSNVILSWPDISTLQSATNVGGPYIDITSATSPYTNATGTTPRRFFKLR